MEQLPSAKIQEAGVWDPVHISLFATLRIRRSDRNCIPMESCGLESKGQTQDLTQIISKDMWDGMIHG